MLSFSMLVKQKKMKMIAAESERFVPFGRKFLDVHPKGANRNENVNTLFIIFIIIIIMLSLIFCNKGVIIA